MEPTVDQVQAAISDTWLALLTVGVCAIAAWYVPRVINLLLGLAYLRDDREALSGVIERGENMPGRWNARGPSHLVTWWVHGLLKSKRADGPDQAHEIATQACADGAYEASVWVLSEVVRCDTSEDGRPDK